MLFRAIILACFCLPGLALAGDDIKIKDLPVIEKGLKQGTFAIAPAAWLKPTQPQVGFAEVLRKESRIRDLQNGKIKHSKKLFRFLVKNSFSPAYIIRTPKSHPLYGTVPYIVMITDRTHASLAQARVIEEVFGKKALADIQLDHKGRPSNYILVQIAADLTDLSEAEVIAYMKKNNHLWLKRTVRRADGFFETQDIEYSELPNFLWQTANDPVRGFIGELQYRELIPRIRKNYFQFFAGLKFIEWANRTKLLSYEDLSQNQAAPEFEKKIHIAKTQFLLSPEYRSLLSEFAHNGSNSPDIEDEEFLTGLDSETKFDNKSDPHITNVPLRCEQILSAKPN